MSSIPVSVPVLTAGRIVRQCNSLRQPRVEVGVDKRLALSESAPQQSLMLEAALLKHSGRRFIAIKHVGDDTYNRPLRDRKLAGDSHDVRHVTTAPVALPHPVSEFELMSRRDSFKSEAAHHPMLGVPDREVQRTAVLLRRFRCNAQELIKLGRPIRMRDFPHPAFNLAIVDQLNAAIAVGFDNGREPQLTTGTDDRIVGRHAMSESLPG